MAVPVKMPQMGESVVEGTVARWHKQPGDRVEKLEPLLEISTDKIDTEVPAPAAGMLLKIEVAEGETVQAGTIIAYIGEEGEASEQAAPEHTTAQPQANGQSAKQQQAVAQEKPRGREFISPVVARVASEHDVDLEQVEGTGLHGRITKKDILAYVERQQLAEPSLDVVRGRPAADKRRPQVEAQSTAGLSMHETLQPLTAMRRAIAEHMTRSVRTSPHVTTLHEVDMTAVVRHREEAKGALAARGIRLTFTPYFVAAVAEALRAVPEANSRFSDDGIVLNRRIHVGVAVSVDDGLLVPVIRDADERNLAGLARVVFELAEKARSGRLTPDDLRGGTFTITNHGTSGSLLATPIINQPQAGILGVGTIAKRPVVRSVGHPLLPSADDAIVIRPMCYLSFSFDHRILDGVRADEFVTRVKDILEKWGS